jgi:hypothetical protein
MSLVLRKGGRAAIGRDATGGLGPIGVIPEPTNTAGRSRRETALQVSPQRTYVAHPARSFLKSLATAT